jgi:hypothetical protein
MVFPIVWLMTMPCVVDHTEPGDPDEYGDHPPAVSSSSDERCWVSQSRRGEEEGIEFERWNIYFPPEVTVDANDMVTVNGELYHVLGAPWKVVDPLTALPTHIEATAVRRV